MKPIATPETNATFVLEGCLDLPATKCHDENGTPYVQSCWELSEEEKAIVAQTGRVYLVTMGNHVAPVLLSVQSIVEGGET